MDLFLLLAPYLTTYELSKLTVNKEAQKKLNCVWREKLSKPYKKNYDFRKKFIHNTAKKNLKSLQDRYQQLETNRVDYINMDKIRDSFGIVMKNQTKIKRMEMEMKQIEKDIKELKQFL